MRVSEEEIEAKKTPNGGWTKIQLAEWGVPWPPPKGWKTQLIKGSELPHPFKCSKCDYIGSSRADVNDHYFEEHS